MTDMEEAAIEREYICRAEGVPAAIIAQIVAKYYGIEI